MKRMLEYSLIAILLILTGVASFVGALDYNNMGTMIFLIIISALFIIGGIFTLIYALAFKFGKKIKAKIINKTYVSRSGDEPLANEYYYYKYEFIVNNKTKTGHFKIFYIDSDISSILNVGDEIQVNRFLFATAVDDYKLINDLRNAHKNDTNYQMTLNKRNKSIRKNICFAIIVLVLLFIFCLVYTLINIK